MYLKYNSYQIETFKTHKNTLVLSIDLIGDTFQIIFYNKDNINKKFLLEDGNNE